MGATHVPSVSAGREGHWRVLGAYVCSDCWPFATELALFVGRDWRPMARISKKMALFLSQS